MDIYINYDCDRASLENIYERLINIVAKIGQTHFAPPAKNELAAEQGKMSVNGANALSLGFLTEIPELAKYSALPSEQRLRRQALECVVAVLKSLVAWVGAANRAAQEEQAHDANERNKDTSSIFTSEARMSVSRNSGSATPEGVSGATDVEQFAAAKHKKTALLEGIRKFGFKPKHVRVMACVSGVDHIMTCIPLSLSGHQIPRGPRFHQKQ